LVNFGLQIADFDLKGTIRMKIRAGLVNFGMPDLISDIRNPTSEMAPGVDLS
jgi:hypothetical protein